jgi:hypothetical protein
MSGQFHVPVTLPQGKENKVSTWQESGRAP